MAGLQWPDWAGMFVPDAGLAESFLRGTIIYFAVLVLVRIVPRRQVGSVGLTDVLLVVLLSECVSQALSADAKSIPNGLAAMTALLFWNFALDWAAFRWKWVARLLEARPVPLIRDGKVIPENLCDEKITCEELESKLREEGVERVADVKAATMEPGGKVSVIPKEKPDTPAAEPDAGAAPELAPALERFLAAAAELRSVVAWHEERAAEHAVAAKEAKAALARHGVRPPRGEKRVAVDQRRSGTVTA